MKNCGHNNINCGCKDTYLTTPPPCPTPVDCPDPQPCSEVFDAKCIVYTGTNILCGQDIVVSQNDSVAEALASVVDYFCDEIATSTVITADIFCQESPQVNTLVVPEDTLVNAAIALVVEYFCDRFSNLNLWLTIEADTGSTSADNPTDTLTIVGGTDISTSIVGDTLTINYTGSGGGLPPWQVVTVSPLPGVPYQTTLSANSRTIYNIGGGAPYAEFTVPAASPVGTEVEFLYRGASEFYIKPTPAPSNTTVQIWRATGYLSATSFGPTRLEWNALTAETYDVHIRLLCVQNSGGGIIWVVIQQTWNDQLISVVP